MSGDSSRGSIFRPSRLGAAITMPLLPLMIASLGWKVTFLALMAVGLFWTAVWWKWFRDEPFEMLSLPSTELSFILANRQDRIAVGPAPAQLPLGRILSSSNMWLMMGQYFASNFTFFFCLSWLFPYVQKTYGLSYTQAGFYAMIPLLCGAAGNISSGLLVDGLFRAGHAIASRRLPASIGFVLAAIGLAMSVGQAGVWGAVFWLSVTIFGADMTLSPSWSFCIDIAGRHAGRVSGTMNMAGNLGSALVALAFPYLLRWTGGPRAFFHIGAVLSASGALAWLFADSAHKIQGQSV